VDLLVVLIFWGDRHSHPGVNAALVSSYYFVFQGKSGTSTRWDEDVFLAGWLWDQISVDNLGALRGRNGIARWCVEKIKETPTEPFYFGKSVRFTT
jgi:hypothetical protein